MVVELDLELVTVTVTEQDLVLEREMVPVTGMVKVKRKLMVVRLKVQQRSFPSQWLKVMF